MLAGDRVFRLPLSGVNAYLVDADGYTLVDAGTPWDRSRVERLLASRSLTPGDVDRILVTHYDVDHVGTLAALPFDAPVYAADPDASYLTGESSPSLADHKGLLQRLVSPLLEPPASPVYEIDDGDVVGGFTAYRTPGHTPGHTAYVHREYGVAFLGDMVRERRGRLVEPPRALTADSSTNRRSIRAFRDRVDPFDVAAPGHGDPLREAGYGALCRLVDRLE